MWAAAAPSSAVHLALILWCQLSLRPAADGELIKDPETILGSPAISGRGSFPRGPDWGWQDPAGVQQLSVTMQGLL